MQTRKTARLDRPSEHVPSVDRPWDDPTTQAERLKARPGDQSSHRAHHTLYEDMLN